MDGRSSLRFRFPRFTHVHRGAPRHHSEREHFLTTQLTAANKQNSALRRELSDQRDSSVHHIHSLRQQKSSLEARIAALTAENDALHREVERATTQSCHETDVLRSETQALKRRLGEAHRKNDVLKSALMELSQEVTAITSLLAAAKIELRVVRREREAALDDACTIQNLLERERAEHEFKEYALQKEIIDLRKGHYHSRDKAPTGGAPPEGNTEKDKPTKQPVDEDVENPIATDSISTEILTPRQERTKYHVLFSPQIPMTPIRALDESDYVVKGDGFDSIREPAFAAVEFGRAKMEFRMVLNEPFSAWGSAERPTMMYIGFEYPDGTSLCYVPLRDVRVKYPPRESPDKAPRDHTLGADYGRDYVQLCIREELYHALVEHAKEVFATRYSTENVELPRVGCEQAKVRSRLVSITASLKPDARVERLLNSCKQKTLLSKELLDRREDIVGDALLAMRFSKAYPNESGYMLGFKLHEMLATG